MERGAALRIAKLRNPIRNYAWGSRTVIAELLGNPVPSAEPEAELWIGAHPLAPSKICVGGEERGLDQVITDNPTAALGEEVAQRFGDVLPFLMKLIAVDAPLSLQVHPDSQHAAVGFERENAAGIPLDAPERCYKDPRGKPEILCALTEFVALAGFREPTAIAALVQRMGECARCTPFEEFERSPSVAGVAKLFESLLRLESEAVEPFVQSTASRARLLREEDPAYAWLSEIHARYPRDVCTLAPLLLNVVHLVPGEVIALRPGTLHAYLRGAGIEVMGSSDNVLRAGLTEKHVDVPDLLRVIEIECGGVRLLESFSRSDVETVHRTPLVDFELSQLRLGAGGAFEQERSEGPELLLCIDGSAMLVSLGNGEPTFFDRGAAFFVPACEEAYRIEGNAHVFRAHLPFEELA